MWGAAVSVLSSDLYLESAKCPPVSAALVFHGVSPESFLYPQRAFYWLTVCSFLAYFIVIQLNIFGNKDRTLSKRELENKS